MFKLLYNCTNFNGSKIMLKILCSRLQQYVSRELPDIQAGIIKGGGTRDQIANTRWIIEKAREFQKNICFIDYAKSFDCVDHNKLWKILKETGIPDHLTCLLRNLYAGQEATVRTGHGTTDWFQNGKGECQGCILSPCLFNLYAEYIMWNAGLDKAQLSSVAQSCPTLCNPMDCSMPGLPVHHQLYGHEFEQAPWIWWTEKPGMLQSMGLQRVGHDWATELNWYKMQDYFWISFTKTKQFWFTYMWK